MLSCVGSVAAVREANLKNCSVGGKQGTRGPFQDSVIAWEDFMEQRGCVFGGVFDGHGAEGKNISSLVRDNLPIAMAENLENILEHEGGPSDFCHVAAEAFLRSFKQTERKIVVDLKLKAAFSGSTAIAAFVKRGELLVANLGDCRCLLAQTGMDGDIQAVQVTEDHKLSVAGERNRVLSKGGRIISFPGDPPIDRMIHPSAGGTGLAVSRCFGDTILKKFGLSAEPELLYHRICPEDKFLIMASDGLWDVMSNEQAVDIVLRSVSKRRAALILIEKASQLWAKNMSMLRRDDISVAIIYLEGRACSKLVKLVSLKRTNPSLWQRFKSSFKAHVQKSRPPDLKHAYTTSQTIVQRTIDKEPDDETDHRIYRRSLSASSSQDISLTCHYGSP